MYYVRLFQGDERPAPPRPAFLLLVHPYLNTPNTVYRENLQVGTRFGVL